MTILKLREVEKTHIVQALESQKGNRTHTARALGIGIRTLQRKLKRYGMAEYLLTQNGRILTAPSADSNTLNP